MDNVGKLVSIINNKNIEDCKITGNKLKYSQERIKLNAAFMYMKSLFVGPLEYMEDQKWILENCFDYKGNKTEIGKIILSDYFNFIMTPEVQEKMKSSFRGTFQKFYWEFNRERFNEDLYEGTRHYFRVKGKYLIETVSKLRAPQVMCLRNTILNKDTNFHKKACVMKNPEYDDEENDINGILDNIESANMVTDELINAINEKKVVSIAMIDKIVASCR